MRSVWKGHIQFSLVTIPVRIYNAIDTAETIKFNQLHQGCNGAIGYDKRCKKCNQVVASQEIVKGYQYEPDQYVIVDAGDFEKLKLKSTKIIEIEGFVNASEVDPMLYETPYYAGPDGEVAGKAYALLCETLKESGRVGIGKVVLREREDAVLIAPRDGGLALYRLRYPKEVRSIKDVPDMEKKREIDKDQLKLARSLVETMVTTFSTMEIKDRYTEALREMIESKVQGKEVVAVSEEARPAIDIMTALKQSIEKAKAQRQGMIKATGKEKRAEPAAVENEVMKAKASAGKKRA
jgi:DNA end-binding protein Ku